MLFDEEVTENDQNAYNNEVMEGDNYNAALVEVALYLNPSMKIPQGSNALEWWRQNRAIFLELLPLQESGYLQLPHIHLQNVYFPIVAMQILPREMSSKGMPSKIM